jgi:endonuclease-3
MCFCERYNYITNRLPYPNVKEHITNNHASPVSENSTSMYNDIRMKKNTTKQILNLLTEEYGNRRWKLNGDPVAELVRTILSQNTSDHNSHLAFASLKSLFRSWEQVARANLPRISEAIRAGGLAEIKAKYIMQSLKEIKRRHGSLELDFLKQFSIDEARSWLMQLPGVGMKTASCVLLFSLGMPALPVDTHVSRVSRRLGLLDAKSSIDKAHKQLEEIVPKKSVYEFHVLLIEHGRKTCKAQHPLCEKCALQKICPSYEKYVTDN